MEESDLITVDCGVPPDGVYGSSAAGSLSAHVVRCDICQKAGVPITSYGRAAHALPPELRDACAASERAGTLVFVSSAAHDLVAVFHKGDGVAVSRSAVVHGYVDGLVPAKAGGYCSLGVYALEQVQLAFSNGGEHNEWFARVAERLEQRLGVRFVIDCFSSDC